MTFLKTANSTESAPATIIDLMRKNIGGLVPQRSHKTVHASDVTQDEYCARRAALFDLLDVKTPDEVLSTELAVTFDVGNATANLFKEKWSGLDIVGHWTCSRCGGKALFQRKPPATGCYDGGLHDLRYDEVQVIHMPTLVSGSFDALMDLGGDQLFITELKIIAVDEFASMTAPKAEHRIRTQMYMRMVEESDSPWKQYINTQMAKVFYISRGHGKKHPVYHAILPFKEFNVHRDDELVDPYLNRAKPVRRFREEGLMPEGTCSHSMCAQAIKCPVKAACFGGKYPAGAKVT